MTEMKEREMTPESMWDSESRKSPYSTVCDPDEEYCEDCEAEQATTGETYCPECADYMARVVMPVWTR